MYIKLRVTSANPYIVLKILDWCINNRPATGSNLATQITAAGGNALLANSIDQTNTQIWNAGTGITALTSKTVSKFTKTTTVSHTYQWYVQQEAYDNANYKHCFRILDTSSTTNATVTSIADHFSSVTGSMVSGITSEAFSDYNYGGASVGGSGTLANNLSAAPTTQDYYFKSTFLTGITGATMFITDNCFAVFFTGNSVSFPNGVPAGTYATGGSYVRGISLAAQYTRTDPWNNSTSNIPPWVYAGISVADTNTGAGFMNSSVRFTSPQNVNFTTTPGINHLLADRGINATPSNTLSTFPFVERVPASLGIGNRFDDSSGLTVSAVGVTSSSSYSSQNGPALSNTAGARFISADLKSTSYALLPMTWCNRVQNNAGGSISDRSGIYIFNGDYFPGDTLVSGTKTYILWNGCIDQFNRIALAIPRE